MDYEDEIGILENDNHRVEYKIRKIGFPVAIVFSILLLVVCIVLAVLYSHEVNKSTSPRGYIPAKYETCGDEQCLQVALEMVKKMNKSADPCQDFYTYACGGWQQRTHLKDNVYVVNYFSLWHEENKQVIKKELEQAYTNYSQNAAVMKTVRVYDSCINTSEIDSYGVQPLKDLIKEYGGWSVSSNYDPDVTIESRIGKFARELNVDTLFKVATTFDPYNSNETIIELNLGSPVFQSLSSLDSNGNGGESSSQTILEYYYLKYMYAVGRMLGSDNSSVERMNAIFQLEKELMEFFDKQNQGEESSLEYILKHADNMEDISISRMSLSSFCKKSGFSLPFMQEILKNIYGVNFQGTETILAKPIKGFQILYQFYKTKNKTIIADYFMWQAVNQYIDGLGYDYTYTKESLLQYKTGAPPAPRWQDCIDGMMGPFDLTLGLLYVDVRFKDDYKKKLGEMVDKIRNSFIENLKNQDWMDSKTRELAKEKALAITDTIGYPKLLKNRRELEAYYNSFKATDNLFRNLKAMSYFIRTRDVNMYGRPVDKNEWVYGSPSVVNALYFELYNKMVVFAGIIHPEMYSSRHPNYLNYGGIGMIIGHEIMHGFDGSGRKYDKNGNLNNWWSESADASFKQKASCFERQYSGYKFFGAYINGTQTLDENIADNGGLKIAYDAYQHWAKKNGTEKILPGLQMSPDQLFFLRFSQAWCSKYRKAAAMNQLKNDEHTTERYRVIGSLSNFKKFSEAFNCPANSPMNPSTKCSIW